jgi:molybdopterin/thiamine biosynthesis adenylyltransferase
MGDSYPNIFSRNIGVLTGEEQEKIRKSAIAIAGVGGVGSMVAERLIRMGVGKLKITDPDVFDETNLNRHVTAYVSTLGQNKAGAVFKQLKDINPQAEILYNDAGITDEASASDFVSDCDMVIDEMDFGMLRESVILQREARRRGQYYIFSGAIAFGGVLVIFDPRGLTMEEYDKIPFDVDLRQDIPMQSVPMERIMPVVPSYVPDAINTCYKIMTREIPAPTVSIGVALIAVLTTSEAINIILRKRDIAVAPAYTYIDLLDRKFVVGSVQ